MLLAAAAVALAPPRVAASRRAPPPRMTSAVPAPPRELAPLSGADEFALGFDFGTSSARCVVIDGTGAVRCEPEPYPWGERERTQRAVDWADALDSLLRSIPADVRGRLQRIAVSGTSGSVLLVDDSGEAAAGRGDPRMYDFSVAKQAPGGSGAAALELLAAAAPAGHTARSATSALAKVLAWHCEAALGDGERIAHQADYVFFFIVTFCLWKCSKGQDGWDTMALALFHDQYFSILIAPMYKLEYHIIAEKNHSISSGGKVLTIRPADSVFNAHTADCKAIREHVRRRVSVFNDLQTRRDEQEGSAYVYNSFNT